ncbi:uncharacterized protein LOC125767751 [Anopheles funestus]|uniref:uncharacterized protein LOC125767751 n=1 Tax=Anopheles funestus TaxID=62324 RepID=UPI0020C64A19|nr:uncharacterized protein LOC125767751 [Anopheles funestus]
MFSCNLICVALGMELKDEQRKFKRKQHSIDRDASTSSSSPKTPSNQGLQKMSSWHGNSYQIDCTFLIVLGGYERQLEDKQFNYTITLEDPQGGKFDDVVLRCPSQNSAVYMQCKHKKKQNSTATNPLSIGNKKGKSLHTMNASALLGQSKSSPFSIPVYFMSFLQMQCQSNHSGSTKNHYLLCTNAEIDEDAEQYFTTQEMSENDIFKCFKNLDATFHQLDEHKRWDSLEEKLRQSSLSCLAKSLAKSIYKQDTISLEIHPIFDIYAVLINNIIEQSSTSDAAHHYEFKQTFRNASDIMQTPAISYLREKFIEEYKPFLGKDREETDVWKDILKKGIKTEVNFSLAATTNALNSMNIQCSEYAKINEKITEFNTKFRLVCTPSEEQLRTNAKQLLSKLTNAEQEATYDSLHKSICNIMENSENVEINKNFLNHTFTKVKRNTTYTQVKELTREFIKSLTIRYADNLIRQEWLENSNLYKILSTQSLSGMYYYRGMVDVNVSSIIILQTLQLLTTECLFIHASMYSQIEALENIIVFVCEYLNDQYLKHYVVVVVDKQEIATIESFTRLHKSYQQRLIILTKTTEEEHSSEKCLLVCDLTEEASNKLFEANDKMHLFGTTISLKSIVQETVNLAVLFDVLNVSANATESTNINLHNYEKIKPNYIQRDFETYSTCMSSDELTNRNIKKHLETIKDSVFHKSCSFEEVAENRHVQSALSLVQSSISKPEEHNAIDDIIDDNKNCKVFIFLDEAGFGKSTYFTWLAWRLSEVQPSLLVIKLNAVEYSSEFDQLKTRLNELGDSEMVKILFLFVSLALAHGNKRSSVGIKEVMENREFYANMLHLSNERVLRLDEAKVKSLTLEQVLELRLFCNKFNDRQLILLLDGYDEIVPDYSDVVNKCFAWFANCNGIRKIYLSCRPYDFEVHLKHAFRSSKILRLKSFSHHHQILSLHKQMLSVVKEYYDSEKRHQTVVLSVVYAILNNRLGDLANAPLLLHMAIDSFLQIIRQYIFFPTKTISDNCFANEQFNTFQIVHTFVQRKLEILLTEKSCSTDTSLKTVIALHRNKQLINQLEREHTFIAIYIMFDKSRISSFISDTELNSAMENISEGREKTGILVGVKNGIPIFIHKIFAEYFAASWLFHNRNRLKNDSYFKSQLFWNDGLNRTRDFFDQMIVREQAERSEIHLAVLNKSFEQVKAILLKNPSSINDTDIGGRTPLHLAFQHDHHPITRFLLENMSINSINSKDDIFGWSALDYAFVRTNKHVMKSLFEFEAKINLNALLEQLFSNDSDTLLIQACNYINYLTSVEETEQLAKETVNYLCNKRGVDINAPREKLKNLTIIEFCIMKNTYELFKQFILHLANPTSYLSNMAHKLFHAMLEKKAYNFVCFLVDEINLYPQPFKKTLTLFAALKSAIELDRMKSFQLFLDQLCFQLQIDCADDDDDAADDDVSDDFCINSNTPSLDELAYQLPKSCCVRKSTNVLLSLPEYVENNILVTEHLFETLLARAAHKGNVPMMKYIIKKFQKPITNRTIVTVMRLLPKGKRMLHDQSIHAFKYLLHKTTDLQAIDEEGRNLLHMTIHNGCYFMVLCLIDTQLDRTLLNERIRWNVFHYIASSESKYTNRALHLYQQFMSLEHPDRFDTLDINDNSVYEIAVINSNCDIAREMIEITIKDPKASGGFDFVLDSVTKLVDSHALEVLEYFKYLFQYGDLMWMELYSRIRQRVPLI